MPMSNYDFLAPRERKRSLFIVEGQHEKFELIALLLKCFPEINIREENIIVFETNIYVLYDKILEVYGEDWDTQDVDLTMIVRNAKNYPKSFERKNFSDIIMIFDYERHDPMFSEDKIRRLQEYFNDSIEVGKLYINYPMVESYMHFPGWPNSEFEYIETSTAIRRGNIYKTSLNRNLIAKMVKLPTKIDEILADRFKVGNSDKRYACVEQLLLLHTTEKLDEEIEAILSAVLLKPVLQTAKKQMESLLLSANYCTGHLTYFEYMRNLFVSIIKHNIYKANKIQGCFYNVSDSELRNVYFKLDFSRIVDAQNASSRERSAIGVLNTSVFFVPEYKFSLIEL